MESIIAFATVISVITIALTQLVKQAEYLKCCTFNRYWYWYRFRWYYAFIPEIVTELSIGGRLLRFD